MDTETLNFLLNSLKAGQPGFALVENRSYQVVRQLRVGDLWYLPNYDNSQFYMTAWVIAAAPVVTIRSNEPDYFYAQPISAELSSLFVVERGLLSFQSLPDDVKQLTRMLKGNDDEIRISAILHDEHVSPEVKTRRTQI